MDTKKYKPKQLRLREMPEDVYHILLDEQTEHRKKCNCQFSLESTIYKVVRKIKTAKNANQ